MKRRTRRGWRPALERMESRELLSGITAALANRRPLAPMVSTAQSGSGATPVNEFFTPTEGEVPTPRELARERFVAAMGGPYAIGPGMFTDQALHISASGVGSSSAFLHGNYQMSIVVPKDPTQPITGVVSMFDRNINSGGLFSVDLTGTPGGFDRAGRPNLFTYVTDVNLSAGIFGESDIHGTLQVRYQPSGRPSPGGFEQGTAQVLFRAQVFTVGTNNPLHNANLVSRGGRVRRRS